MERFRLEIATDNAAFDEGGAQELVRILRTVQEDLIDGYQAGPVRDINGNTVGRWSWDTERGVDDGSGDET